MIASHGASPAQSPLPPTIQIRDEGLTQPVILDGVAGRATRLTDGRQGEFANEGSLLRIRWADAEDTRYRFGGACYIPVARAPSDRQTPTHPQPAASTAVKTSDNATSRVRVAVVTAYYREPREQIERALTSVKAQSIPVDHIVVADGYPQDWIDDTKVRHIRLDTSHRDYGNTPRGIGALLAIAEDYDAICFLDADNWLEADHVEGALVTAQTVPGCDYVIARRYLRRPDETILPIADEPLDQHVDTNCFFFLKGAYHALPQFALIPRQMSSIGDRLFYKFVRKLNLKAVVMDRPTVNYHCLWESVYRIAGEAPPPGAKPNIDTSPISLWLSGLTPTEYRHVALRSGGELG